MPVEIWPAIAPEELKAAAEISQKRELEWFLDELQGAIKELKHGLEECYALLAPVDPGSTLVLTTPRNESVKGYITRVGTRIVKGTIHLRLKTHTFQTLIIDPDHPIHLGPLISLHALLTHSIDLVGLTLSYSYPASPGTRGAPADQPVQSPHFLAAQLRLLAQSMAEASAILRGPPLTSSDPSWTTRSVHPSHFMPPLATPTPGHGGQQQASVPPLSFHLSLQDGSLVLWLRTLEPADAPVNFGTKLALAIGTARRLEHDEADIVFGFCCVEDEHGHHTRGPAKDPQRKRKEVDVYVREKVRVESADPSLLSLSAKLNALAHALGIARKNLAAVMGEELED